MNQVLPIRMAILLLSALSLAQTRPPAKEVPNALTGIGTIRFQLSIAPKLKDLMIAGSEEAIVKKAMDTIESAGLKIADAVHNPDGGAFLIISVNMLRDPRHPDATFVSMNTSLLEDAIIPRTGAKVQATILGGTRWEFLGADRKATVDTLVDQYLQSFLKQWAAANPTLAKPHK
jgi:hypothetical protein